MTSEITQDTVVECIPSRIFGSSVVLSAEDSYIRVVEDDSSFPRASLLESKIKDINSSQDAVLIEAIVLQMPNETEVTTKSSEVIPLTDTILGDDTGEQKEERAADQRHRPRVRGAACKGQERRLRGPLVPTLAHQLALLRVLTDRAA